MKNIFINIKNLIPYLILILIYFFFVNIEARKDKSKIQKLNKFIENERQEKLIQSENKKLNKRISIPVIPFQQ
tara:strand:- start:776 stop:994 length:219 start_codon:yes stop_codon:yes gene_type:complete